MKKNNTILRKYQKNDLQLVLESLEKNDGVLYQLMTGGGKSVIISEVIQTYKNKKILFLAHRRELLLQMRRRLQESGLKVGVMMSEMEEELEDNIVIASIQTATREKRLSSLLEHKWDLIVIDEAHHLRSPSYDKLLDALKSENEGIKIFGVTATPYRSDKKEFTPYFQDLITSLPAEELVAQGYLAGVTTFSMKLTDIETEVVRYENDYQTSSLSEYMRKPKYLQYLVDMYKEKADGKQMIVFCVDIKHAKSVMETYINNGYTSIGYIDSSVTNEERDSILLAYRNKELDIIVCIETLTEGVDLPETSVVQIARPTKSIILFSQMGGRGTRPKEDGSNLILLDCGDCMNEHGHLYSKREWTLDSSKDPNSLRKGNKVVAKRNGEFIEFSEVEDGSFDELVELSMEEYLMNFSGSIEKMKEKNSQLDDEISEILKNTHKKILEKFLKEHATLFIESSVSERYFDFSLKTNKYNPIITIGSYSKPEEILIGGVKGTVEEVQNQVNLTQIFTKNLLEILKITSSARKEIAEIKSKKVDIYELKEKVLVLKEEKRLLELQDLLSITDGSLFLKNEQSIGQWFSNSYGWVNEIKFSRNKLLSTNDVTFIKKTEEKSKKIHHVKFLEKKKILEIFSTKLLTEIRENLNN